MRLNSYSICPQSMHQQFIIVTSATCALKSESVIGNKCLSPRELILIPTKVQIFYIEWEQYCESILCWTVLS
jgi:hypothetical protein